MQGCQIFIGTKYKDGKIYPMATKYIYQMAVCKMDRMATK
jgi:hypothetical protein